MARQMLGSKAIVSSAGIRDGGHPASENANLIMKKMNLDCSGHISRKLDKRIIDENDFVIFLDRAVAAKYKMDVPKSKLMIAPVKNPFKLDADQFIDVAIDIANMIKRFVAPCVDRMYAYKNKEANPGTPGAPPASSPSHPGSPS